MMETKTKECFEYCYEVLKNQGGEEESFMKRMEELAKPELKPVDLSVLAKSGIDCEFFDVDGFCGFEPIGLLGKITNPVGYKSSKGSYWPCCRPRMNHWHNWQGGECPLPEGLEIEVVRRGDRGGRMYDGTYGTIGWEHMGDSGLPARHY